MSDRAAFLTAILDEPADDTVRLVYADHLRESADRYDQLLGRFIWSGVTLSQFRGNEPVGDGMFFDAIKEQTQTATHVIAIQVGALLNWDLGEFAWDNAVGSPDRITARFIPPHVEGESIRERRARRRLQDQAPSVVWERGCISTMRLALETWIEVARDVLGRCPLERVEIVDVPGLSLKIVGPLDGWRLAAEFRPPVVPGQPRDPRDPDAWRAEFPGRTRPDRPQRLLYRKDCVESIVTASRVCVALLREQAGERWTGGYPL